MVNEPDDRIDPQLAQPAESFVRPAPIVRAFPEHGVAHASGTELGKEVEVAKAVVVAAMSQLVEVRVADSVDGAFDPGP